ncbi:MAG: ligase-associated DNA damage response endonuclease PdeM [Saprospiraceae bacterium]
MQKVLQYSLLGQSFFLSAGRAVYWEGQRALVLSDLHIGKGGHFRKAGIPIPGQVQEEDLSRLGELVGEFDPKKIIVVGDMFHSAANSDLDKFKRWREAHSQQEVVLVKGNHDILKKEKYGEMGVQLEQDGYGLDNVVFYHQPPETAEGERFTISGHLHPGILVEGNGRQRLRLPCFWFPKDCLVLPAFSAFTGLFLVKPQAGEKIIAIADGELIPF